MKRFKIALVTVALVDSHRTRSGKRGRELAQGELRRCGVQ